MTEHLPFSVDLGPLLAPISPREPSGEWLRYEGTYDAVQDARREEDESLPTGIWQSKLKRADWSKVDALCQKALRERTKDLQLAVWLSEAWLQLYGLRGFAGGLVLIKELIANFWDTLYPLVDEGDTAYRLAPLDFLDRKVAVRLKQVTLTAPAGEEQRLLTFADWEQALHNEKLAQNGTGNELGPAQFLAAAAGTPPVFFTTLHADLSAVAQAAVAVEAAVAQHTGEQNSVLRGLRALVADIMVLIAQYTPATSASEGADSASAPRAALGEGSTQDADAAYSVDAGGAGRVDAGAAGAHTRSGGELLAGPVKSRGDAYHRLNEAADYLLRTEPHSPVPYLVKRAISWGNMNLMQLLSELVSSDGERAALYALLGIKVPQ